MGLERNIQEGRLKQRGYSGGGPAQAKSDEVLAARLARQGFEAGGAKQRDFIHLHPRHTLQGGEPRWPARSLFDSVRSSIVIFRTNCSLSFQPSKVRQILNPSTRTCLLSSVPGPLPQMPG